ncbi:methionyl-tRNA formyltransferase [Chryseobacterium shigense]|uniref:DUF4290 domain-containing protein n=1 Tax=Chryseobacterium shigense TaxID=297244 RepID=A0A1N7INX3_9FLAO|nr:DUF4290 domain-containing protein [Chryseobacterium shigense]PQA95696.1 methionyl-tRNA formyltransferase [Chryseobacterium shigense]SIS38787.1 protein of unknown function [Chryseobacterium shigense]
MEYNTQRTQLHMPEYGRIIQQLVERCKELPTKEERSEMAMAIIDFMGQRNPQLRDEDNYKHKLWDHLFILAEYDLDVESPYPFPTREQLAEKPKRMEYPKLQGDFKFYGKSILQLIEKAIELEPGDEKEALIEVIANNMKKSYNVYNKEHVTDDVIFRHLKELSENRLDLTGIESLEKSKIYYTTNNNSRNNSNNGRNNSNSNNNSNKNQTNTNKRRHNNNNNHKNRK